MNIKHRPTYEMLGEVKEAASYAQELKKKFLRTGRVDNPNPHTILDIRPRNVHEAQDAIAKAAVNHVRGRFIV